MIRFAYFRGKYVLNFFNVQIYVVIKFIAFIVYCLLLFCCIILFSMQVNYLLVSKSSVVNKFCVLDGKDGCKGEAFHCPKEGKCIPLRDKCNGVKDCSDGFDEKSCASKSKKFITYLYLCRPFRYSHSIALVL